MITFSNINKSYGDERVLSDFYLSVARGGRVCLMGRSGCGKTTALRLLLGLEKADSGTLLTDGRISVVFQENRLCEDFSALSNVRMVMGADGAERAKALLSELGLSEDMHKPVRSFSGGMKRRTAIARALAADGDILLLDEPFTGLDDKTRKLTAECINRHTEGKTLLLVSHDREDALLLGAEIIEM